MFKKLGSRQRILISSLIIGLSGLFLFLIPINFNGFSLNSLLIARAAIVFLLTLMLTAWSLFYKFQIKDLLSIIIIPGVTLAPYILLASSTIVTINSNENKIIIAVIFSVLLSVITYILLLTVNILNASRTINLPLQQAAKATHFILSLISTYFILIYAFGSFQDVLLRVLIIIPFVYLFSFSGVVINKLQASIAITKATLITFIVMLSIFIGSVWPVEVAYSILLVSIIYYISLNLSVEVRVKYTRALWIEYIFLAIIILLLFLITSNWGINFSII